ncbi:Mediator of RNA polymerase II transcription subunit [Drechslerella dactyloides]|uniref:Mediator of RNA polymerase II transcription subunit 20 n=1 Tax=Drechslerella dactyloides TaxID=74499 RepID=A0AAD6NKZ6_DREDA|nr:Mediator of RNA polymerase II transcription subunit [Drechslerella dactyloides]
MPVTGLYFCPDSGTTQATALAIRDRLSKLYQPVISAKWSLEHRLLRENAPPPPPPSTPTTSTPSTTPPQPRFLQYLDLSYHPAKKFCLVDRTIVTVDDSFESILTSKLQGGLWGMRQTLKAEGETFSLEDFRIRIAMLSQGTVIKGVLVEVEYLPAVYLEHGEGVIRDFIEQLGLPSGGNVRLYFSQAARMPGDDKEPREFSILDTGMQYMELLRFR